MAVLRLGVPERRSFGQPKLSPSSSGLPMFAGQPVTERRDEVIVRQLEVRGARRSSLLLVAGNGWVGGCDQPEFVVQDVDQLSEPTGWSAVADASWSSPSDRICPLISVPVSGRRAFSTA